jgi:general secretion pathway protein D
MNGFKLGSMRRLYMIACALLFGAGVLVPTLAFGQDTAPKGDQSGDTRVSAPKGDTGDNGRRRRNRSSQNREGRSAPSGSGSGTGLRVVPMPQGQKSGGPPPGFRVEKGPDGKPILIGPDGKPVTLPPGVRADTGPDGKPILIGPDGKPITGPDGKPITPGENRAAPPGTGGTFTTLGGPGGNAPPSVVGGTPAMPPGGTITMDFRGSDIGNVLKFFAMATNWQIVPDAGLTGPVTIISPKSLTIDQAFEVLQSTLEVRGYSGQLETRGQTTILKIVPLDRAVQSTPLIKKPPLVGPDGKIIEQPGMTVDDLKNQVVTQVFPLDNVDAGTMSRELQPLINKGASIVGSSGTNALIVTDTASNVDRIGALVDLLDKAASNNKTQMFPLQHADATDVKNVLDNLFRQVYGRGRPGAQPAQPGMQPGMQPQPGQPGQPGMPGGQERGAVVTAADTRTNSVIVVASDDNMKRVEEIIKQLDDPDAIALKTKIVKMKYADAVDVADTINAVLSGSMPTRISGGGATFQQRVFGGFGGPFGGFGGGQQPGATQSTDPFAKVAANARTNSLIVTATDERMKKIDDLIAQLDVEVPVETTTFVVPLRNAQASDLAYILGQAFGTGGGNQGYNPFGGIFFNPFGGNQNRNQRQPIQRRQGGSTGGRAALPGMPTRAVGAPESSNAPMLSGDGVYGVLTPGGFVPDPSQPEDPVSRQVFFGGGFGQRQQMATPQYGRGSTGSYVNLLQLRQNVGVVADPGSNSLIFTTTPDNMQAIQQIIDSLDIVPRQVMIEVIIAEASLDATQKLGFQFDAKGVGKIFGTSINHGGSSNFPVGSGSTTSTNIANPINPGGQYGVSALNGNFNALVQALETDNKVRILATPRVFTSNNQQATIDITTNIPIVSSSPIIGFGGTTNNYTPLPVGITLNVTPRITKDGLVTIDVYASDSELLGFDTLQTGTDSNGRPLFTQAPRTSERTTDTSVSVRDGEVVALGGLIRDSQSLSTSKVPLLGDIPLLGALFRSTTKINNKTELMIFMIPHVVDGDAQNRAMVKDQAKSILKDVPDLKKQQPMLDPTKDHPLPQSRVGPPIQIKLNKPTTPDKPKEDQTPPEEKKP